MTEKTKPERLFDDKTDNREGTGSDDGTVQTGASPVTELSTGTTEAPSPSSAYQTAPPHKVPANPGLIVLQWLTYAFWGWTILTLSILTAMIMANFVADADTGGFMPYGIAAVVVLLPISFVCDLFYSKKESDQKAGAETVIMVIHAVLFALFGIGALIWAVVSVVMLATSSGDSRDTQVSLYTALVIVVYYALTFLRTLNPKGASWIRRLYKPFMLISVGSIILLGIIGPVAYERSTRDDRLIESELSNIVNAVTSYSNSNNALPADLQTLGLQGDSRLLLEKNLVDYKKQGVTTSNGSDLSGVMAGLSQGQSARKEAMYRYELCVSYKKASRNYSPYGTDNGNGDAYQNYINAYDHPAGPVCYKLETSARSS